MGIGIPSLNSRTTTIKLLFATSCLQSNCYRAVGRVEIRKVGFGFHCQVVLGPGGVPSKVSAEQKGQHRKKYARLRRERDIHICMYIYIQI